MNKQLIKLGVGALMVFGVMLSEYIIQDNFNGNHTPTIRVEAAPEDMILEYTTTAANQTILLPFRGATNVTINWNNGLSPESKTVGNDASYTYPTAGTYQIVITGTMTGYGFESFQFFNFRQSNERLMKVIQWGTTGVTSLSGMLMGATNLNFVPTDLPATVTNLSYLFQAKSTWADPLNNLSSWDVSNVTNFSYAFSGAGTFNTDISGWDTSSATNMAFMFYTISSTFNQDLTGWDVSNVTNFQSMFDRARNANPDVSTWNTGSATNMSSMFIAANKFNQNIGSWTTVNVTNMSNMFSEATIFNQNLNGWNVSNVTNMEGIFRFANAFNQPLDTWDVSNVTNFGNMFGSARAFNQDISGWDVSSGTQMYSMFSGAIAFNQSLTNWDVSNVVSMSGMFEGATAFNQPINTWNVANVTNMSSMFNNTNFNQPLNNWDVSKVVNFSQMFRGSKFNLDISNWNTVAATNMSSMFQYNSVYNQPVNTWNVNAVTTMSGMFQGATAFNQPLDNWNTSNVVDMNNMFSGASAFNQDITGWNTGKVTSMYAMFNGATIFNYNISTWDVSKVQQFGQMFQDADAFNQPIGVWNTSAAVSMSEMFAYNNVFNQYIGEWDTSKVTNMAAMFRNSVFNQDIGGWDTGLVQYTYDMFAFNEVFNQDLSDWNVGNVTLMFSMFRNALAFNQPLNTWNTAKVTQTHQMFEGAIAFNQPIGNWNMAKNETTFSMFKGAVLFNQDLPWTTSALVNASEMFSGAIAFNGEVETFDMSKVLFANNFFQNATSFNQPIPDWNFAAINGSVGLERFFSGATAFNQDISGWNVANVRNFRFFMTGVSLNTLYYDAILDTLIDQNVTLDASWGGEKQIDFGNTKYSKVAKALKDTLVSSRSWTILDGGELRLTITANDEEIYFGEDEPTYSVSYTGLVTGAGEDTMTNNYAFTRTPGTEVGTYTISVTGGDESYYYVSYATGTLEILKPEIDVSEVTWDYLNPFTYDGTTQTVSLVGVPNLVTVTYENNSATNAGTYTASVTLTYDTDNYELVGTIEPLSWVIEKAEYDLSGATWSYAGTPFVYDQSTHTVTVTGLPAGVTVVNYTGNSASAPGTYNATVTLVGDTTNYEVPVFEGIAWEIFATTFTVTFDSRGGSSVASISGIFGSNITAPADPTRAGFIFNGWSTEIPATMPNSNLELTASWRTISANDYSIDNLDEVIDLSEFEGQDINVELLVDLLQTTDLSEADLAILDAYLRENIGGSVESILYDIRMLLSIEDDEVEITEIESGFDIVVPVPTDFQGKDLYVVQFINGVATTIEGVYDETTQTIRFRVSGLGTYALAYASATPLNAIAIGGGAFGVGLLGWLFFVLFGKRRRSKQVPVVAADIDEDESNENVTIFEKTITIKQPFYEALTPEEQAEFRLYFIDETPQHLVKELRYQVGQMNETFFMDVYRYLYRYRKLISLHLLNKLTDYGILLAAKQPKAQSLIYEVATKISYARRMDPLFLKNAIHYARQDIALQRNVLKPRKTFVYSFYRLSIILEKQKEMKEALVLVNEAIARELSDRTKGGFERRKTRLLNLKA